jgi:hypothetical protein
MNDLDLEITDKNQVLQRSFFDKNGYPKPFFKEILEKNNNSLTKSFKILFPYSVVFEPILKKYTEIQNSINSKDLWICFYGEINFRSEEDARRLETILKLLA